VKKRADFVNMYDVLPCITVMIMSSDTSLSFTEFLSKPALMTSGVQNI